MLTIQIYVRKKTITILSTSVVLYQFLNLKKDGFEMFLAKDICFAIKGVSIKTLGLEKSTTSPMARVQQLVV